MKAQAFIEFVVTLNIVIEASAVFTEDGRKEVL